MLGISYGELFLLFGATIAFIRPKDLPVIARTAGRLTGRSIGYIQMARGQFETVIEHTQTRQVHKELQDGLAKLEAIRHELRAMSFINPGPLTRRLVDNVDQTSVPSGNNIPEKPDDEESALATNTSSKHITSTASSTSSKMYSQATTYARLAESAASLNPPKSMKSNEEFISLTDESGRLTVLPISAESAKLLPHRTDEAKGSDIVLEAILEAEVAHNAKDFFAKPENQIKF